ncbi:MAG TPA: sigma factor, partial [Ilumatobacteraceae bacterium]|nr:sigma factor [Ilumatobacteraceae bacterium]
MSNAEFAEFYRSEFDGQVRRAALFLGSEAAGADAVHDAFVALFRRWDQIREPGPYLNRTVLNRCRDVARRDQRAKAAVRRSADRGDDRTVVVDQDPLWDVLAELPFNQRAAVVLREHPGQLGLCSANGGYVTKHAIGLYSTEPPANGAFRHADVQAEVDRFPTREVTGEHVGAATIEAYTVMHDH